MKPVAPLLKKLLREPLVHFLALGALLFALASVTGRGGAAPADDRIEVTAEDVRWLRTTFARTWMRPPTAAEMQGLLERHIRDEVLYREALQLGLADDDAIIRQRLVQKMQFLYEDVAVPDDPPEADLRAYFEEHADAYRLPPRRSFAHVYFSPDRRGYAAARDEARRVQAALQASLPDEAAAEQAADAGDRFMLDYAYADQTPEAVARTFGRAFADTLFALEGDGWLGPVRSGYGLHLVRITAREDGRLPAFEEVEAAVRRDYAAAHRVAANERFYAALRETAPGQFDVRFKIPYVQGRRMPIEAVLPAACAEVAPKAVRNTPSAVLETWRVACAGGLVGETITIAGLERLLTDVLVQVQPLEGALITTRLRPVATSFVVPARRSLLDLVVAYVLLGIEHILLGLDHLLFVLGLLLIVRGRWMLLKTITSFTIAHSITLALATLGVLAVPALPLNAVIALSILFLGPEIVRAQRGETSLTIRHPWVVAFAFGLLHGFGFASGLSSLGMPEAEIPLALLFFNVGVEVGQLFFVGLVLALAQSFRQLAVRWPRWAVALPAYVVGGLGAFWTLQRAALLF
jgi:hypothetical protein